MARPLILRYGQQEVAFQLNKVDRSRLYGFKEREVLDETERLCELATLADDGRTVVGRGGTGLGYLTADGEWCQKSELRPIDVEGQEITPVKSSFEAPIDLIQTATTEEYLDHIIRLVYVLDTEDDGTELWEELKSGTIYTFPYSYRGGLQADAAFLLAGADNNLFLVVGNPSTVRMVGLPQTAAVIDEETDSAEEGDLMDFDMI